MVKPVVQRSRLVTVNTVNRGNGLTLIEIRVDHSLWKAVTKDGDIGLLEAMTVAAVELKLAGAESWLS